MKEILYKKGDIVELINLSDIDDEGYYLNQYRRVPVIGHKYHVAHDVEDDSKMVSLVFTDTQNLHVYNHEVCLYKSFSKPPLYSDLTPPKMDAVKEIVKNSQLGLNVLNQNIHI